MSRFDYVKYDGHSQHLQDEFKTEFIKIEQSILENLESFHSQRNALQALEECYMWIGKSIRDDQIARNGSAELQESRG